MVVRTHGPENTTVAVLCQQLRLFAGGNDWSHYGYMEETLGQRIRKARGAMKQHEVVALIRALPGGEKFTQQTLSKLENNKQESPGSYIPYIAYVCKVSALWLVANIGPMRTDYFSEEAADIARTYETLSPDERQYIKGWMDGKKKATTSSIHQLGTDAPRLPSG